MPQRLVIAAMLVACTHDAPPLANIPAHRDAVDDLALIPANASFVVHVDATTFRATPFYTQLVAPELARAPELALLQTACGFDPLPLVTSVTFAAVGGMSDDGAAELVVRGVPRARTLACLPKLSGSVSVSQDRDTWVVTSTDRPMGLRFVGEDVLVIAIGPSASQAGTNALLARPGLSGSASFRDMHAKVAAGSAWFVTTPPAALDIIGMPGVRAAFGAADLRDGAAVDITIRLDNPATAASAARRLHKDSVDIARFTSRFEVDAHGSDVRIIATVDRDKAGGPHPQPVARLLAVHELR